MRMMVVHHRQALVMTALAPDRAASQQVKNLAARIEAAQGPEIAAMQAWLETHRAHEAGDGSGPSAGPRSPHPPHTAHPSGSPHGAHPSHAPDAPQSAHASHPPHEGRSAHPSHPAPASPAARPEHLSHPPHPSAPASGGAPGHGPGRASGSPRGEAPGHDHGSMPGMATDAQLKELERARGKAFDRLFLQLLITHHEGAVVMASEVLRDGRNTAVQEMAGDVIAQQTAEIHRMGAL
nr:DUF305 domain-containing protein [Streptomyces sp. CC228A]